MAVKKKTPKRKPSKKKASKPLPAVPVAIQPQPSGSGMSLAPWIILGLVIAALVFVFKKGDIPKDDSAVPPAHKMDAGIQTPPEAAPSSQPSPKPVATPQKRSTSPAGPLTWDRKKTKAPARFYVLREKDSVAEVRIFRAGNVPVRVLTSETGPKRTVVLSWDGKDSKGADVRPGTYYARISLGSQGDMVQEIQVK
jgi:hypothetical protein